jgi:SnoaL-like domain
VTEEQVRELIGEITADPDPDREYELRHPECAIDIPQSGERFDRDGMREFQRNFPGGPPAMTLRRLAGEGDVWVAELTSDYGEDRGGVFNVCLVLEFDEGLIKRETRYYAEPFDPPAERRRFSLSD